MTNLKSLILALSICLLVACAPSQASIAAAIAGTQTVLASAITNTPIPTDTISDTPTITDTPTSTDTPTITNTPTITETPTNTPTSTKTPTNTPLPPPQTYTITAGMCLLGMEDFEGFINNDFGGGYGCAMEIRTQKTLSWGESYSYSLNSFQINSLGEEPWIVITPLNGGQFACAAVDITGGNKATCIPDESISNQSPTSTTTPDAGVFGNNLLSNGYTLSNSNFIGKGYCLQGCYLYTEMDYGDFVLIYPDGSMIVAIIMNGSKDATLPPLEFVKFVCGDKLVPNVFDWLTNNLDPNNYSPDAPMTKTINGETLKVTLTKNLELNLGEPYLIITIPITQGNFCS